MACPSVQRFRASTRPLKPASAAWRWWRWVAVAAEVHNPFASRPVSHRTPRSASTERYPREPDGDTTFTLSRLRFQLAAASLHQRD